jgi:triacylglycerol lipase
MPMRFFISPTVQQWEKEPIIPLNPIYRLQNQLIYQNEGVNDSFVTVESAKWGKHQKHFHVSHLEQIEFQLSKERRPKVENFWKGLVLNLKKYGY